ncbi:MAG TPA: aldolase/citrate lyase family protein [Oligoflexia bacterium]|nr:aldolase/citrate lyase family protein [Oligoflexia bacterium]HMP27282.1 aldolase/citrate lyase family protein [Oligoflexia bacterium]
MSFELYLFYKNQEMVLSANQSMAITTFVIDWEYLGKKERQIGYNTSIRPDSREDLSLLRSLTTKKIICRINNHPALIEEDIRSAIDLGADEILLPMVKSTEEIYRAIELTKECAPLAILLETVEALEILEEIKVSPISKVYVGLSDLMVARKSKNLFEPIIDGTLEQIRNKISKPFGFGGVTTIDSGAPIPCKLLLAEMVRLKTSFSFLRSSFFRDIADKNLVSEVEKILAFVESLEKRTAEETENDHKHLANQIKLCAKEQFLSPEPQELSAGI